MTVSSTFAVDGGSPEASSPPPVVVDFAAGSEEGRAAAEALFAAAAPNPTPLYGRLSSCDRLQLLLVPSALLSPIPPRALFGGDASVLNGYDGSLFVAGLVAMAAAVLGAVTVGCRVACRVALSNDGCGLQGGKGKQDEGSLSILGAAAASVRFPATAVQTVTFLSHGAAASAALGLAPAVLSALSHDGEGGGEGRCVAPFDCHAPFSFPYEAAVEAAPMVAAVIVAFVLPCACICVAYCLGRDRFIVTSAEGAGGGATARGGEGIDDDIPEGFAKDVDAKYWSRSGGRLVCGAVRPRAVGRQLGPLAGDLRIQTLFSPAFACVVPIAVFASALAATAAAGSCWAAPLAAGVVYLAYAALVAVARPFLAISHNAVESVAAAVAGACLVALAFALPDEAVGGVEDDYVSGSSTASVFSFSTAEVALCLALVGLSNSRYPFIFARALDVVLPAVVALAPPPAAVPSSSLSPPAGGASNGEAALAVPLISTAPAAGSHLTPVGDASLTSDDGTSSGNSDGGNSMGSQHSRTPTLSSASSSASLSEDDFR